MDFWDNVSVNLFSNAIWVVVAYATMQIAKRLIARRDDSAHAVGVAPGELPVANTPKEIVRRVIRSVFALAGLLISILLVCSFFVGTPDVWRHVAGWFAVVLTWTAWFWCTREPQSSQWLRRSRNPVARFTWIAVAIAFWAIIFGGLIYVVYGIAGS